jgi:hypothetical protein
MSQKTISCPYHDVSSELASPPQGLVCGCRLDSRHASEQGAKQEATAIDGRVAQADGAFFVVIYQPTTIPESQR